MRSLAFSAALFLFTAPAFAKGILASPTSVWMRVTPGESITAEISFAPTDQERVDLSLSMEPFSVDLEGKPVHGSEQQSPRSRPGLFTLDRDSITLRGSRQNVTVRFVPSPGATGSYWAAVIVETDPVRQSQSDGSDIAVVTRVIIPVFVTVTGTGSVGMKIEELTAVPGNKGEIEVSALLHNTGNTVIKTPVFCALEDRSLTPSLEIASLESSPLVVLPGEQRRIRISLKLVETNRSPTTAYLAVRAGDPGELIEQESLVGDTATRMNL